MAPLDVIFSSSEKGWSDSPRAIEAELRRRGLGHRGRWLLPESAIAPGHVERIPPGTEEARAALESADLIVSNTYLLQRFATKPGAVYLQTWHGTPLKRIGHDIRIPRHILEYEVTSRDDAARWDLLVVPNRFSLPIFEAAFPGTPTILTGYPRNDLLRSAEAEAIRDRTREDLGLEPGQRAVLYAPTFRDEDLSVRFGLSPEALALPEDVVVLARAHVMTAGPADGALPPQWRDVTAWPEIGELYLAADALITDYSSALFDFAVTGKPLLFYVYDLEHYRDESRGFTFDFEASAPGPLLRTPQEVAGAIADLDAVAAAHAEAHAAFVERFCELDDGAASGRVLDAALAAAG